MKSAETFGLNPALWSSIKHFQWSQSREAAISSDSTNDTV